jgi:hypothetical protein
MVLLTEERVLVVMKRVYWPLLYMDDFSGPSILYLYIYCDMTAERRNSGPRKVVCIVMLFMGATNNNGVWIEFFGHSSIITCNHNNLQ